MPARYFIVVLFVALFVSCQQGWKQNPDFDVICDLESVTPDGQFFYSKDSAFLLKRARARMNEQARSGEFSLKLSPQERFGLGIRIPDIGPDDYFLIKVWKKGPDTSGFLVADIRNNSFYEATRKMMGQDSTGWKLIQLEFFIPPTIVRDTLLVYVWNPDTATVYFDDLHITYRHRKSYPEYDQDALRLFIDSVDMITLNQDRQKAFIQGILESDNSSWVPAILFMNHDQEIMKAKVRLKGDWLDHLAGEKWSFRIKLNRAYSWRHMRVFSIQTPVSRDFLNEWVAHRLFDQEDVLTTSYEFIPVYLKDQSLGYYACEEHFDKHLVESRNRREGPIMKFTEEAFWAVQKVWNQTNYYHKLPCFETAVIEPFKFTQTVQDPILKNEFLIAQNLLYEYKNSLCPPSELFDLDKLARYYALCDVTKAWHCISWHNQRFYYNPVLCRLEPIAFDGYTHVELLPIEGQLFVGEFDRYQSPEIESHRLMHFTLFEDMAFTNLYIAYLEKYSSANFILEFMGKIDEELNFYETQLRKEFPDYQYDRQFLVNHAAAIRKDLGRYKEMVAKEPDYARKAIGNFHVFTRYDTAFNPVFPDFYVKAYMEQSEDGQARVRVINNLTKDILLLGTGRSNTRIRYFLHPEPTVPAFIAGKDQSILVESDTAAEYLFFMVKGHFPTHIVPVLPWPYPTRGNPRRVLEEMDVFHRDTTFARVEDEVIFKRGKHILEEFLVIPENRRVVFEPGCILDLRKKAGIISYSPVYMTGNEDDPVIITSSDSSAMGFTVLQAPDRSHIRHAVFEHLNTLDFKGWTLTGAVNFYESDVDITHTLFLNNYCEDALNTIRSDFVTDRVTFQHTFADAFDSDFCTGKVTACTFIEPGNDAIDFSGSTIEISDCIVKRAGDKGISGGEKSTLNIRNCDITECNIGIATKDLSELIVKDSRISGCNYGVTAYCKKVEYGPGKLNAVHLDMTGVKHETWVEEKSRVIINDVIIPDDKKDVVQKFN